ncbi:MAG TPA: TMEM175 family protein [Candidatus Limnocylindrales bacterium]|jgi:uncharacterized membrane protein|nr:TMEM175 family protein [Candidatus Limnocylindrales bacterium]
MALISLHSRIAGHSLERLAALSDGIFAVAMTLLVLDLRVPMAEAIHSQRELALALFAMWPKILMYAVSFLSLGLAWAAQQTEMSWVAKSDRSFAWAQILFLFCVTLLPFTTQVVSQFHQYRLAFLLYWFNISILGATLYRSWMHATSAELTKPDMPPEIPEEVRKRFFTAQGLYTFGAVLCLISAYVSLAFILAVQLTYALEPKITHREAH